MIVVSARLIGLSLSQEQNNETLIYVLSAVFLMMVVSFAALTQAQAMVRRVPAEYPSTQERWVELAQRR